MQYFYILVIGLVIYISIVVPYFLGIMARSSNLSAKEKYERQKELARNRQRRRKEKMSAEKLEEKRKYDRERMARLRQEKKIKNIGDMTPREQRKMRKYWRDRNHVRSDKKRQNKKF